VGVAAGEQCGLCDEDTVLITADADLGERDDHAPHFICGMPGVKNGLDG